jgi:radical SAM protein with 4Fe4S-binding SPASM domain
MPRDWTARSLRAARALATLEIVLVCDSVPFRFDHVPRKKVLNWILTEASAYAKPERAWGWPTMLQVEPDARCNLRCVVCPVTSGMGRPTGPMDLDLFKELIDQVGDYVFLILLWDWGEPFLNPHVYDMITYARQRGIKVISSTNGHLFRQQKHADDVIRSGLDSLIIALDGITQETYELYRQGGDVEAVLEAVRLVVARKKALNSATPLLNLRFVAMKHNEHQIPQLDALARSLGVDALTIKTFNPYESDEALIPTNPHYRRFRYAADKKRIRMAHNPCKHPWNMPSVHWNGIVSACTHDAEEMLVLGDLKADTFKDIWYGDAARTVRRQFRSDWEQIPLCYHCSYAYEGGSCIDETIADAHFYETPPAG